MKQQNHNPKKSSLRGVKISDIFMLSLPDGDMAT